jgi:hypothetical protein
MAVDNETDRDWPTPNVWATLGKDIVKRGYPIVLAVYTVVGFVSFYDVFIDPPSTYTALNEYFVFFTAEMAVFTGAFILLQYTDLE